MILILLALSLIISYTFFSIYHNAVRVVDIRIGEHLMKVEIADTPRLRDKGLSGRKNLKEGYGMLFVFDFQRHVSFWMKDTHIPLSIAFISSDGRILQIKQMTPHDLHNITSDYAAKYALEVKQGFFDENGIEAGTRVDLSNVTD